MWFVATKLGSSAETLPGLLIGLLVMVISASCCCREGVLYAWLRGTAVYSGVLADDYGSVPAPGMSPRAFLFVLGAL